MLNVQPTSFSKTPEGCFCIAFDDVAFVRAETVFVEPKTRQVSALLDGMVLDFGAYPETLDATFTEGAPVTLVGPHADGYDLELHPSLKLIQ